MGSLLILAAPALLVAAPLTEPWLAGRDRPYSRPAIYGSLAGMVLHLLGGVPPRRARQSSESP